MPWRHSGRIDSLTAAVPVFAACCAIGVQDALTEGFYAEYYLWNLAAFIIALGAGITVHEFWSFLLPALRCELSFHRFW